jgi:hypothetical protein
MKRKATLPLLALAAVLLAAGLASAQMPKPEDVVTVRVEPLAVKGKLGDALAATVLATVKDGFHVNSNQPTLEYLIPTRVELPALSLFDLEKAEYPEGELFCLRGCGAGAGAAPRQRRRPRRCSRPSLDLPLSGLQRPPLPPPRQA